MMHHNGSDLAHTGTVYIASRKAGHFQQARHFFAPLICLKFFPVPPEYSSRTPGERRNSKISCSWAKFGRAPE